MLIVDFQVWARHESLWKKKSEDALATGANRRRGACAHPPCERESRCGRH
jgi:hypothetical protein